MVVAENAIHYDYHLMLGQFPRLVPRAAPDFLQTLAVKHIRNKMQKVARMQGSGLHSR